MNIVEKIAQKISSRKLWMGIVAVLASLAAVFLGDELTPEVVDALKCAVAGCIAYILGEGFVDAARLKYNVDLYKLFGVETEGKKQDNTEEPEEKKEAAETVEPEEEQPKS